MTTVFPETSGFLFAASAAVLALVYALIVSERIAPALAALLGGAFVILLGVLDQHAAIAFVDFNTLGLLAGMMLIVSVARKSGVFSFLAIRSAQLVRASPSGVLASFALITALLSAFINNVTVVLLIVPVTFVICEELGVSVYPFLFSEILASNIGGTATLIGDPPNILIGTASGLGFDAFAFHLAPIAAVILLFQIGSIHLLWGSKLSSPPENRARVMAIEARKAIEDRYVMVCSIVVIAMVIAALTVAAMLCLEPATIALLGAGILLLLDSLRSGRAARREHLSRALADVEWTMLIFLVGLFVMVGAVEKVGLLGEIGHVLLSIVGRNPVLTASIMLWLSALLSAVVDNVPYVAAMIPVVKSIAPAVGGAHALSPIWWSLALGAGLGGNGTLIGASANLAVAALAERSGLRFGFVEFAVRAFPLMLASIAVAQVYIVWRYF